MLTVVMLLSMMPTGVFAADLGEGQQNAYTQTQESSLETVVIPESSEETAGTTDTVDAEKPADEAGTPPADSTPAAGSEAPSDTMESYAPEKKSSEADVAHADAPAAQQEDVPEAQPEEIPEVEINREYTVDFYPDDGLTVRLVVPEKQNIHVVTYGNIDLSLVIDDERYEDDEFEPVRLRSLEDNAWTFEKGSYLLTFASLSEVVDTVVLRFMDDETAEWFFAPMKETEEEQAPAAPASARAGADGDFNSFLDGLLSGAGQTEEPDINVTNTVPSIDETVPEETFETFSTEEDVNNDIDEDLILNSASENTESVENSPIYNNEDIDETLPVTVPASDAGNAQAPNTEPEQKEEPRQENVVLPTPLNGPFFYTFNNNTATLSDILAANSIVLPCNMINCWVSDVESVSFAKAVQGDVLADCSFTANRAFDNVILTVVLADGQQFTVALSNPAPAVTEPETAAQPMLASAAPAGQTEEIVKDEADTETPETVKEATEDEPEEIDEVVTVEEESAAEPEDEPVAETEQEPVELTVASTYELQTGSFSYTFKNSAPATLGEILIANGIALPANVGACWTGDMGKLAIEKNGNTIQDGLVDDYTFTPLMAFDSAVFYASCAGAQVTFTVSNPDAAPVEEETTPVEEETESSDNIEKEPESDEPDSETSEVEQPQEPTSVQELLTGTFTYNLNNEEATLSEIIAANGIMLPNYISACWTGDMGKIELIQNGQSFTQNDVRVDDYTVSPLANFDSAVFYIYCVGVGQIAFTLSNPEVVEEAPALMMRSAAPRMMMAAPPAFPAYTFDGIGSTALVGEVLAANDIYLTSYDVILSDEEAVTLDENMLLTANTYFESVEMRVIDSDDTEILVLLKNPDPEAAAEDEEAEVKLVYAFNGIEDYEYVRNILSENEITADAVLDASVEVEEEGIVAISPVPDDFIITATDYFDEAVLTVVTGSEDTYTVLLSNPQPEEKKSEETVELTAEQVTVITADVSMYAEMLGIANTEAVEKAPEIEAEEEPQMMLRAASPKMMMDAPDAIEENPEAAENEKPVIYTKSGYEGYDISADTAELGEAGTYVVPVSLATPIDMTGAENAVIENVNTQLYHIVDGAPVEVENVKWDIREGVIYGFTFETDSFSPYMVTYTVDFSYTNPETGETKTFSFPGRGEYALSEILDKLEIKYETIESAVLELTETVGEKDVDEEGRDALYLTGDAENGYTLHSYVAFDDVYTLNVVVDGKTHVITVKDDSETNISVVINYYEIDGETPSTAVFEDYYYLMTAHGNATPKVRAVAKPSVSGSSATLQSIPLRKYDDYKKQDDVYLLEYTGNDPNIVAFVNDKWDYDSTGTIKGKNPLNGSSIGTFNITKDEGNSNENQWVYRAVKKDAYTVNLNFINNYTEQNPVVPGQNGNDPITDPTYVGMHLYDPNSTTPDQPIGYYITKMPTSGSTNTVIIEKFKRMNGQDLDYATVKTNGYIIRDVVVKHYTGNQQIQNTPAYDVFMNGSEWTTEASDGYTFVSRVYNPGEVSNSNVTTAQNECTVTQRLADPTFYYVKVDCGDEPLEIPEGYTVYAKVNVNNNRYGYGPITTTDGGKTYTVQITQWFKADGTLADKQSINGHEESVSVTLHAVLENTSITKPSDLTTGYNSNGLNLGDVVQSHIIKSYPSIPKDYDPAIDPAHQDDPQRIIEDYPNVMTKYTDVVYLEKIKEHLPSYALEDLLTKYNVITLCPNNTDSADVDSWRDGDFYSGNHVIGGILVRGDLTHVETNIGTGTAAIWPSAVGGKVTDTTVEIIGGGQTAYKSQNFYIGSDNTVLGTNINGQLQRNYNTYGKTVVNDDYVDWQLLQNSIISQADAIVGTSSRTIDASNGEIVKVQVGEHVTLNVPDGQAVHLVICGQPGENWAEAKGTVIINTSSGAVKTPYTVSLSEDNGNTTFSPIDVNTTGDKENAAGISIVYDFPYASNVTFANTPEFGHVIAPRAYIEAAGGDYNGALVGNAVKAYQGAEGHMWPYRGGKLVTSSEGFVAQKTVNNALPTVGQVYTFILDELKWSDSENDFTWQTIETKQNSGQRIVFSDINYGVPTAGHNINEIKDSNNRITSVTHYYRITEDPVSVTDGCNPDPTQYYIKVVVNVDYDGDNTTVTDTEEFFVRPYPEDDSGYVADLDATAIDALTKCEESDLRFDNKSSMLKLYKSFIFDGTAIDLSRMTDAQKEALKFSITTEIDDVTNYVVWDTENAGLHGRRAKLITLDAGASAPFFTYKDFRDGMLVLEGLPLGEYHITETEAEGGVFSGYTWSSATVQVNRTGAVKTFTDSQEYPLSERGVSTRAELTEKDFTQVFFTNTYSEGKTEVQATKVWAGDSRDKFGLREDVSFLLVGKYDVPQKDSEGNDLIGADGKQVVETYEATLILDDNPKTLPMYVKGTGEAAVYITKADYDRLADTDKAGYSPIEQVTVSWENLPISHDGYRITYYVYEVATPDGYAATYYKDASLNNGTVDLGRCVWNESEERWEIWIKNELENGSLQIDKSMFIDGAEVSPDNSDGSDYKFYVTIEYTNDGKTWYLSNSETQRFVEKTESTDISDVIHEITLGATSTQLFTGLPFGKYTVTEYVKVGSGDNTTYEPVSSSNANIGSMQFLNDISRTTDIVTVHNSDSSSPTVGSLVNAYVTGKYCVAVTKQWLVNGETYVDDNLSLTVKLQRSLDGTTWNDVDGQTNITLDKGNNWSYVAVGMDQMDENGVRYQYQWVENIPDGWAAGPQESIQKNNDVDSMIFLTKLTNTRATAQPEVTKEVVGNTDSAAYNPNEEFIFTLAAVDGAPMPTGDAGSSVSIKAGETGVFGEISYSEPGEYHYTIQENDGSTPGMTYDETSKNVTVTVIKDENTGVLTSVVKYENSDSLTITNHYGQITFTPHVRKIIEGDAPEATYNFILTDKTNDQYKDNEILGDMGDLTASVTGKGIAEFGEITYTNAGIFTYEITEIIPDNRIPGMTYNVGNKTVTVTVTVLKNANGTLTSTVVYSDGDGENHDGITNKFETGELEISKKVISDNSADKGQIFTFTVELNNANGTALADGTYGGITVSGGKATITLHDGDKVKLTDLPVGTTYTVTETAVDGFETTVGESAPSQENTTGTISTDPSTVHFTNTRKTGSLTVEKDVKSSLEADSNREYEFTITLDADIDQTYGEGDNAVTFVNGVAIVHITGDGSITITGLPAGVDYTVTETSVDGMTTTWDGNTGKITEAGVTAKATNTRDSGSLEIDKKVFVDGADKTQDYTNKIFYVKVYGIIGGETYWVTANNGLLSKEAGQAKVFEINPDTSLRITQLPVGEYTVIEVANAAGGDLTEKPNADMGSMTYLKALSRTEDGATVVKEGDAKASIINAYTTGKFCVAVTKQWLLNGHAYQDDDLEIKVKLKRRLVTDTENPEYEYVPLQQNSLIKRILTGVRNDDPVTLNKENNWSYVAVGMDQMDNNGVRYEYVWEEVVVPDGWSEGEQVVEQSVTTDDNATLVVLTKLRNSRVDVEIPVKKEVTGNKYTGDEQFKIEVTSVTKDGIPYAGSFSINGAVSESLPTFELKNGETGVFGIQGISEIGTYTIKFKEDVGSTPGMTYDTAEKTVTVVVTRDSETGILSATITQGDNELVDASNPVKVTNKYELTSVPVVKIWDDNNNQDGKRPDTIKVGLYRKTDTDTDATAVIIDGTSVVATLGTSNRNTDDANKWEYTFTDLPMYDANGKEYTYSVKEEETTESEGTTLLVIGSGDNAVTYVVTQEGNTITNSYEPSTVSTSVTKAWEDNNNQDGKRPTTVTMKLYANNEDTDISVVLSDTVSSQRYNAGSNTAYNTAKGDVLTAALTAMVSELPEYVNGVKQTYTWQEDQTGLVDVGYTIKDITKDGNTTTITNTYNPTKYCLTVLKVWDDQNNKYNSRPADGITVELYKRTKADSTNEAGTLSKVTGFKTDVNGDNVNQIILKADNNWTAMVLGVDKYEDGKELEYFWKETSVPDGYTLDTTGAVEITTTDGESSVTAYYIPANEGSTRIGSIKNTLDTGKLTITKQFVFDRAVINPDVRNLKFTVTGYKDNAKDEVIYNATDVYLFEFGSTTADGSTTYSITLENLPLGYYEVVEDTTGVVIADYTLYAVTVGGESVTNKTATIDFNKIDSARELTAEFVNEYHHDTGDLSIHKTVVGALSGENTEFSFVVALSDSTVSGEFDAEIQTGEYTPVAVEGGISFANGTSTTAIKLKADQTLTISGLPTSVTYTVTETPAENYELSKATNDSGVITKAGAIAEFVNTRKTADLTVTKTVKSSSGTDGEFTVTITLKNGGTALAGKYDLTKNGEAVADGITFDSNGSASITGVKHGDRYTIQGLPVGITYTVVETGNDGFTVTYNGETSASGETLTVDTTVDIVNTRDEGSLAISKTVVSRVEADKASTKRFEFTITMTDGNDDPVNGTFMGELSKPGQHDSSLSREREITFVDGKATIDLAHDETMTVSGIPVGYKYYVTEEAGEDFTSTSENAGSADEDARLVIAKGAPTESKFTNTRKTADLSIDKTVISDVSADQNATYTFTVRLLYGTQLANNTYDVKYYESSTATEPTNGSVTFTEGEATINVKAGGRAVIVGLPVGATYHISEQVPDGFTCSGTDDNGFIIENGSKAAFVNEKKLGGLTVKKTVNSDEATDLNRTYHFTVELFEADGTTPADLGITSADGKPYGGMTFKAETVSNDGVTTLKRTFAEFELGQNETKSANDLPAGLKYKVTEETVNGMIATSTGETGSISETPSIAAFTNTRAESGLIISKSVESALTRDKDKEFNFTLTLYRVADPRQPMANETFTDAVIKRGEGISNPTAVNLETDANGQYNFSLKHGQILVIQHLPEGARYKVAEQEDNSFTVTKLGDEGQIRVNGANLAEFINTRKPGVLKLKKVVNSPLDVDQARTFQFNVVLYDLKDSTKADTEENRNYITASLAGRDFNGVNGADFYVQAGHELDLGGLPADAHFIVKEVLADDQTGRFEIVTTDAENHTIYPVAGTISSSSTVTAVVTNNRKVDDLVLKKTVVSPIAEDLNKEFNFTISFNRDVNGDFEAVPSDSGKVGGTNFKTGVTEFISGYAVHFTHGRAQITLKGGATLTIKGVPTQMTYTVFETKDNDFQTDGLEKTGEIIDTSVEGNTVSTVSYTNTRKPGELEVSKIVSSQNEEDKNTEFEFTVLFNAKLDKVTVRKSTDVEAKKVSVDNSEEGKSSYTFKLKHGETMSISGLPIGIGYAVTEAESGFATSSTGAEGTITTSVSKAVFTNTLAEGGLVISKTVKSDIAADKEIAFDFSVTLDNGEISGTFGDLTFIPSEDGTKSVATFTLKDGQTKSVTGLPIGTVYTVKETLTENQQKIFTSTSSGMTGNITPAVTAHAEVTNTRKTGELEISKKVVSSVPADTNTAYTFNVTLTAGTENVSGTFSGVTFDEGKATVTIVGNGSITLSGLPVGAAWSVVEPALGHFTTTVNGEDANSAGGEISETKATAGFVNTRKTGELEISKKVESPIPADLTKSFSFTILLNEDITGTYNTNGEPVSFVNGKATVTVKGSETLTITGLPEGVNYTVVEVAHNQFEADTTEKNGTISSETKATAAFTNTRRTGSLEVSKTVVSSLSSDKEKEFSFKVTLSDNTVNGKFGEMTFENGVAEFKLKHNQNLKATGIPVGITYTVEEAAADGFVITAKGEAGTICLSKSVAAFTNVKSEGGLVVSKKVISPIDDDHTVKYEIVVTLDDETVNGDYGDARGNAKFTNGIATLQLADGEIAVITGLPAGTGYTVTETAPDGMTVEITGATGTVSSTSTVIAQVINSRETAKLIVSKTVAEESGAGLTAADQNEKFAFTVELKFNGKPISGDYAGIWFTDGKAQLWLQHNQSIEINGIPVGTTYTVKEVDVPGRFTVKVNGVEAEDNSASGTINSNTEVAFTNTVAYVETTVTKVWADNSDQDGMRPDHIDLKLYKLVGDGEKVQIKTVRISGTGDTWTHTETGLPKYENGETITYSWDEYDVPGYTKSQERNTITNTYTPELTEATVKKVWDDAENQDGKRPASLTVALLADGEPALDAKGEAITATLKGDEWTAEISDLPKYKDGKDIKYTWSENDVPEGYDLTGNVTEDKITTLTNSYTPETVDVSVEKKWQDAENQDGIRPADITVQLKADDKVIETVILSPSNHWTKTWTGLAKNKLVGTKATAIVYTVDEVEVPEGYVKTLSGGIDETANYSYVITNRHDSAVTQATVTKVWDDNDNAAGRRPASVTMKLLADNVDTGIKVTLPDGVYTSAVGYESATATISGLTATVNNLPLYRNGDKITYSWIEETSYLPYSYSMSGLVTTVDDNGNVTTTITNSYDEERFCLTVLKVWKDNEDQDKVRPEKLTVYLYANEAAAKDDLGNDIKVELNAENNWTAMVTSLPIYKNGAPIAYSWLEEKVSAYNGGADPAAVAVPYGRITTLTNEYTPEITSVPVRKIWKDDNNKDGIRPASVKVELLAGKVPVAEMELSAPDFAGIFENLPKFNKGEKIEYTVREINAPEGYTFAVTGTAADGFTITNTHVPEKTEVTVKKIWDDNSDQDGKRPASLTVKLFANGADSGKSVTLNEANSWTATIKDLDKFAGGKLISYTWDEGTVTDYELTKTETVGSVTMLTNTHREEKTSIKATKVWQDDNNRDGKRAAVIFELQVNGNPVEGQERKTIAADATGDALTVRWDNLQKYKDGKEIEYTVAEVGATGNKITMNGAEYTVSVSGDRVNGFTITNSYNTVSYCVGVTKTWVDQENKWNTRPDIGGEAGILVSLQKSLDDGKTWVPYDAVEGKFQNILLNESNGWTYVARGVPMYEGGKLLQYRFSEVTPYGYELTSKFVQDAENPVTGEKVNIMTRLINTLDIKDVSVEKVWADNSDQDGMRPDTVTVALMKANGYVVQTVTLSAADKSAENTWSYTFKDLPAKDKDTGVEIEYTVVELKTDGTEVANNAKLDDNYTATYTVDSKSGMTTITNTHTPATTEVKATKVWDDNNNQDGKRIDVTFILKADGEIVNGADGKADTRTIAATATGEALTVKWTDLPKYKDGREIEYTVEEAGMLAVDGKDTAKIGMKDGAEYIVSITGNRDDGFVITNTYSPKRYCLAVTKNWIDRNDKWGTRPAELKVTLKMSLDEALWTDVKTFTLSDANGWSQVATGVPMYQNGTLIKYQFVEENLTGRGYVAGKTEAKQQVTLKVDGKDVDADILFVLTNTMDPTSIKVTKKWDDDNNRDGKRPTAVEITLLANGEPVKVRDEKGDLVPLDPVLVTSKDKSANTWTYTFRSLPKVDANGKTITYTVEETPVAEYNTPDISGYTADEGFVVTNTYVPKTTEVEVTKTWVDGNNQDGKRPTAAEFASKVHLLANGVAQEMTPVVVDNGDNTYTATFANLPMYDKGVEINYSIAEDAIKGYTTEINGFTITNTHTPEVLNIKATKVWVDNNNQDGLRKDVVLTLKADGVEVKKADGTADNRTIPAGATGENLTVIWENMPKYRQGQENPIVYTISENEMTGYTWSVVGDAVNGFKVENRHDAQAYCIAVHKTWDTASAEPSWYARPKAVYVTLMKRTEGTTDWVAVPEYRGIKLSAENKWEYLAAGLPVNEGGKKLEYQFFEDAVPGYKAAYSSQKQTRWVNGKEITIDAFWDVLNTLELTEEPVIVTKKWDDNGNAAKLRPQKITVELLANGNVVQTAEVMTGSDNTATYSFGKLPKYDANGEEITYTVREANVDKAYQASVDGMTITNTLIPTTFRTIGKVWNHGSNAENMRPASVKVTLLADGKPATYIDGSLVGTIVLNAANSWGYTVENLPVTKDGKTIKYTWDEAEVLSYSQTGYTDAEVTGGVKTTITNTYRKSGTTITTIDNSVNNTTNNTTNNVTNNTGTTVMRGGGGTIINNYMTHETIVEPKLPGEPMIEIEDYGTPLGINVIINHVGDCFD